MRFPIATLAVSLAVFEISTYNLKLSIENCGQTAADGDMVTTTAYR